jgi:hypothetical protein
MNWVKRRVYRVRDVRKKVIWRIGETGSRGRNKDNAEAQRTLRSAEDW